MEHGKKERKKAQRSPSYPMISLEEAINRVQILWKKNKKNPMHKEVVFHDLGYKHIGGHGARVVAALKKFDLISENKGSILLTEKAVDLMIHGPDDEQYIKIIKVIALSPSIYKELYEVYNGELPASDQSIRVRLIKEHDFNPDRVDIFIDKFRATIKFAGLTQEDLEEGVEEEDQEQEYDNSDKTSKTQFTKPRKEKKMHSDIQSFDIPLLKQNRATLAFEKLPIEKGDLERIKQWIDLIAAPLVETEEDEEK